MNDRRDPTLDLLTIFAIAILAYILANVLHEGVGHAGICVMVGCDPLILTTAHVDWQPGTATDFGQRLIAAGGTLVNLLAALIFWLLYRSTPNSRGSLRYFYWFSMAVNLLIGTGYFLFSSVMGIGDWMQVVAGWEPAALWQVLLIVLGIVFYLAAIVVCLRTLAPLIGGDKPAAIQRAVRLTTFPYLVGSLASTLGSLLNPEGMILFAISAAAHFGGTSALAWSAQLFKTKWFPLTDTPPISIPRGWVWIGIAAAALAIHIVVLGPGIGF